MQKTTPLQGSKRTLLNGFLTLVGVALQVNYLLCGLLGINREERRPKASERERTRARGFLSEHELMSCQWPGYAAQL